MDEIDPDHPLYTLLHDLRQSGQVTEMELSPLDPQETAQMAQQIANRGLDPLHAAMVYRVTEGNPLLIQEMIRAEMLSSPELQNEHLSARQRVPPSKMESVIQARLARLSRGRAILLDSPRQLGVHLVFRFSARPLVRTKISS